MPNAAGQLVRRLARSKPTLALMAALALALASGSATGQEVDPLSAPDPSPGPEPFVLGPPSADGPVVVRLAFELQDINDIDDGAETFEFRGRITATWRDPRQAFDPDVAGVEEKVYQGGYQFSEVYVGWFPQVVLLNESGLYETRGRILRVRHDGTATLSATINAVAEGDLNLRRYPMDEQLLEASFGVIGANAGEVVLEVEEGHAQQSTAGIHIPQWSLTSIDSRVAIADSDESGQPGGGPSFVVAMDVDRDSLHAGRLVVLPLTLVVIFSWAVFWMNRSMLGDRINVSFVGILTAVAYQIVVADIMPDIAYITLLHGFVNSSFIIMGLTVGVNIRVGLLDDRGESELADAIDRRCRWMFPAVYIGWLLAMGAIFFAFF